MYIAFIHFSLNKFSYSLIKTINWYDESVPSKEDSLAHRAAMPQTC